MEEKRGRGKALMRKGLTKDEYVRAKVTPKMKEAVLARAASMEMNESEYLRFLIMKDLEENS